MDGDYCMATKTEWAKEHGVHKVLAEGTVEVGTQVGKQKLEMWKDFKFGVVEMNHLSQHSTTWSTYLFWTDHNTERLISLIHTCI